MNYFYQNSPAISFFSSSPIASAAGTLGRPGIVIISPHTTTTNSANEEVIGQVTAGTKEDIDKAVSAALDAFSSFQDHLEHNLLDHTQYH